MNKVKPFLRWAGSKRKLLPKLREYWSPNFKRYVEPFMGSACFFFDINPQKAILSDINFFLVETFNSIRENPFLVNEAILRIPLGKENYYQIREMNHNKLTEFERAARFIYLNRFCFNGLYRTNKKGHFNVPFSPIGTGSLPSLKELLAISERLQNTKILCCDFEEILGELVVGDFVYLDPPYVVKNKRVFNEYFPNSFSSKAFKRFSNFLYKIDKKGVRFLLSYAECDEANNLFKNWTKQKIKVQRNIAGFAKHRQISVELLISNFSP